VIDEIPRTILLVEDNDDDAFITERAFTSAGVKGRIHRCADGQSVIDYLSGLPPYGNRQENPVPHLILLDLKVPRKTGLEVLEWIRQHEKLSPLVVLVLTSSCEPKDVEEAYKLHVNAYLVKPTSLTAMTEIATCICRLWLDKSSLIHPSLVFPFLLSLPFAQIKPV
jgi:CheY-like chemotaxis protein